LVECLCRAAYLIKPKDASSATVQRIQKIPASDVQPSVTANAAKTTARRNTTSAQNLDVFQGGRTVPSGLLQPPGTSSSAVISVPAKGQPTKNNNAVGATGQWKKKHTAAVRIALKARNGSDEGMSTPELTDAGGQSAFGPVILLGDVCLMSKKPSCDKATWRNRKQQPYRSYNQGRSGIGKHHVK
jgi:hypothetical protein